MQTIETLKDQTIPYRPNRRQRELRLRFWAFMVGAMVGFMLCYDYFVLAAPAHGQVTFSEDAGAGAAAMNRRLQENWDRIQDREQRERFHRDYELDRREYGVNPDGRDAQGPGGDEDE